MTNTKKDMNMDTVESTSKSNQSVGKIAEALAKAQANIKNPTKSRDNYFGGKYADGASIRDAITSELAANDIAVIQPTGFEGGKLCVITTLIHKSGDQLVGFYPFAYEGNDPQKQGSAMSYARRYSLQAMVNVWADDEDDGTAAAVIPDMTTTAKAVLHSMSRGDSSGIVEIWGELSRDEKGHIWRGKYFDAAQKDCITLALSDSKANG